MASQPRKYGIFEAPSSGNVKYTIISTTTVILRKSRVQGFVNMDNVSSAPVKAGQPLQARYAMNPNEPYHPPPQQKPIQHQEGITTTPAHQELTA